MSDRLESSVEGDVCEHAQKLGFLTPKVTVVGHRGWPDRLFISPNGEYLWIEFKKKGKVPGKLQEYRIEELRKRGCKAFVVDNVSKGIEYVNTLDSKIIST